jgi:hypothetical protein
MNLYKGILTLIMREFIISLITAGFSIRLNSLKKWKTSPDPSTG